MFRAFCVVSALVVFGLLAKQSAMAGEARCEGAIVRIEGENVTVKDAMKEHEMKVDPGTKITSGGKPVMVSDLKVGQKVQCVLEKRGDKIACIALEIMRDTP